MFRQGMQGDGVVRQAQDAHVGASPPSNPWSSSCKVGSAETAAPLTDSLSALRGFPFFVSSFLDSGLLEVC